MVVGGGYAGVLAALRAQRRMGADGEVVLVSDRDALIERIRLHETIARGRDPRRTIASLLRGTRIRFVLARCEGVDLARREVRLGDAVERFDRLILAIGSEIDPDAIPGARAHAHRLEGDAAGLADMVSATAAHGGRVVVVGGGLTGLEAATELAERYPGLHVALLTGHEVGERLCGGATAHVRRVLARLGVELREHTRVDRIEAGAVIAGGARVPFDLSLAASGFRAPAALARWGLPVDRTGRVRVDGSLRVIGAPFVYVAGDCAAPEGTLGSPIPGGCKSAMPMGAHAGDEAARSLSGQPARAFDFRDPGLCISLGRRDAVIQLVRPDGLPSRTFFTGFLGARIKEMICRYTMLALDLQRRGWMDYAWLGARAAHTLPADALAEGGR